MKEERFTPSGIPLKPVYTSADVDGDPCLPGEFPYTRGIYPNMYRSRPWAMVQVTGYDLSEDTKKRVEFYAKQGIAHYEGNASAHLVFDMPTLLGLDSDDPRIYDEIGRNGVHINSLKDMEALFHGWPLDRTHASLISFATTPLLLAMYVAMAQKQGVPLEKLVGSVNNCPLLGPVAENILIFPLLPSFRLSVDVIKFCLRNLPQVNPFVLSIYDCREKGATAIQELGISMALGTALIQECIKAGLRAEEVAPKILFFFNVERHFFEEIAKLRAARRLWAKIMKEKFNNLDPKSQALRLYTHTASASLQAQEPLNNIARAAIQALAAALAGVQVIDVPAYDEALGIPTEQAAKIAVKTQRILMHETGITDVADPLGGSYYVEWLTDRLEQEAMSYLDRIEKLGGYIAAVESGFLPADVEASAYKFHDEVDRGERMIVGVNCFRSDERTPIKTFQYNTDAADIAVARIRALKAERDNSRVNAALANVRAAAVNGQELMPAFVEAVGQYATIGEITGTLRGVFGVYKK
ncbi:MAG: methylmalonyl-CoA mutase [Chloroflexi bacterium]|nr:methylmalonyl-CoA mutase [Chloroflexota bacterium]